MKNITYEEILKKKKYILIDARSPAEFLAEGIPGAINIPALLDDERAIVGTAYKQISKDDAKKIGIDSITKRLPEIFQEINSLSKEYKHMYFYCAKGGMRSGTLTALFSSLGYNVEKLQGGYQAYRKYILDTLPELNKNVKYIVIHGKTAVGKTRLLKELKNRGYNSLDLEGLAHHKGSFFGSLCETSPQNQKKFESSLFNFFKTNSPTYVIVESESKRIGNVYIPDCIYNSILEGIHLFADTSIENRVEFALEDYSKANKENIKECILKVGRYTSKEYIDNLLILLEKDNLKAVSKILMEDYYDKLYEKSIIKYHFQLDFFYNSIAEGSDILEQYLLENLSSNFQKTK